MTNDKRRAPRVRKRVRVLFSDGQHERSATTFNMSMTGISVISDHLLVPGAEVHGKLVLPTAAVPFRAEVMWARKPRVGKALDEPNAMGFRFSAPLESRYEEFLKLELRRGQEDFTVPRTTAEAAPAPGGAAPARSSARTSSPPPMVAPAPARPTARISSPPPPLSGPNGLVQAFDPSMRDLDPGDDHAPAADKVVPPPRTPVPVDGQPPVPPGLISFAAASPSSLARASASVGDIGTEEGAVESMLSVADLAMPPERGASPISLRCATERIKEALVVALASSTPAGTFQVGMELDISVAPTPATPGARVRTVVRLIERTADRQQFSVAIIDGTRTLGSGRYVCRFFAI